MSSPTIVRRERERERERESKMVKLGDLVEKRGIWAGAKGKEDEA
jgi:hypothetical protein